MSSIVKEVFRVLTNLNLKHRFRMGIGLILSILFPKKEGLMIFTTSLGRFAQNSKYMFLESSEQTDIDAVWINNDNEVIDTLSDKGYRAINANSLKAKYLILRAEYVIFDNYIPSSLDSWLYLGSKKVNLWHGVPYKKIKNHREIDGKLISFLSNIYHNTFTKPDYFLETNRKYHNLYETIFRESKTIKAGYPRNDVFNNSIDGSELFAKNPPEEKYIVYMPTFRGYNEGEGIDGEVDLQDLDNFLGELNKKLILKPHHRFDLDGNFDNIIIFEKDLDPYPLLKESEALITDYSSVMFDYMHTGNPIIRFQFDKKEYEEKRGLNNEIKDAVPGKEVKTIEELKKALKNLDEIGTDYQDNIDEIFEYRKEGLQAPHILDQIRNS